MTLEMKKFGKILNGRPAGKEAVLRVKQIINGFKDVDEIVLDFNEVEILTPSFADEFIKGIKNQYPVKEVKIINTEKNPVIKDTLKQLNLI